MSNEEILGQKKSFNLKPNTMKIIVIAIVAIIVAGGVAVAYRTTGQLSNSSSPTPTPLATATPTPTASSPSPSPTISPTGTPAATAAPTIAPTATPSPSPSPSPSPTPTPVPTYTHTVNSAAMMNPGVDLWNQTITNAYTAVLNDTMTVSSGNQMLDVEALWQTPAPAPVWTVTFVNSTSFDFWTYYTNGTVIDSGYNLPCNNGIVHVVVTATQITFTGTSSTVSNVPFQNLIQMVSLNGDGTFNGGTLVITLTTP